MKKKWVPAQCPEDCVYRGAAGDCCYLAKTGELRGGEPGKDCGKYTRTGSPVKRRKYKRACKWDNDKGFAMFLMGKNAAGAEKNIRWAIEGAWKRMTPTERARWFGHAGVKPRIGGFLVTAATEVRRRTVPEIGA